MELVGLSSTAMGTWLVSLFMMKKEHHFSLQMWQSVGGSISRKTSMLTSNILVHITMATWVYSCFLSLQFTNRYVVKFIRQQARKSSICWVTTFVLSSRIVFTKLLFFWSSILVIAFAQVISCLRLQCRRSIRPWLGVEVVRLTLVDLDVARKIFRRSLHVINGVIVTKVCLFILIGMHVFCFIFLITFFHNYENTFFCFKFILRKLTVICSKLRFLEIWNIGLGDTENKNIKSAPLRINPK